MNARSTLTVLYAPSSLDSGSTLCAAGAALRVRAPPEHAPPGPEAGLDCLVSDLDCLISDLDCLISDLDCLIADLDCLISDLYCLIADLDCLISDLDCLIADLDCLITLGTARGNTLKHLKDFCLKAWARI